MSGRSLLTIALFVLSIASALILAVVVAPLDGYALVLV